MKENVMKEFVHTCIDEICGRAGGKYKKFGEGLDWFKREHEDAYKLLSGVLRNPACLYLSEEKMPPEFHELPEAVQQQLLACLKIRREELTKALLKEESKNIRETVVDFDWRLKMVMGSSKLASLREPLVQLDLVVEKKEKREVLDFELNKEELGKMINALESVLEKN